MMFGLRLAGFVPDLVVAVCAVASVPRDTDAAAAAPLCTRKSLRFISTYLCAGLLPEILEKQLETRL